jgi:hypothetical protein
VCLAYTQPWIHSPTPIKTRKEKKKEGGRRKKEGRKEGKEEVRFPSFFPHQYQHLKVQKKAIHFPSSTSHGTAWNEEQLSFGYGISKLIDAQALPIHLPFQWHIAK